MRNLVVYHASCLDGFGAAWSAYKKLGADAKYIAKNYSNKDLRPFSELTRLYILDFSYPKEFLEKTAAEGHEVILIDHHKTAMEDLGDWIKPAIPTLDLDQVAGGLVIEPAGEALVTRTPANLSLTFDMTKSGASLSWEHFHPGTPKPKLINFIEDRDLWKFELEHTKDVLAALSLRGFDFDAWDDFAAKLEDEEGFQNIVGLGRGIREYQTERAKAVAKKATIQNLGRWQVPVFNNTHLISETLHEVLELHPEAKFAASFFVTEDRKYVYSLRSRGDFDVAEIAIEYKGGGHAAAAGFTVDILL